MTWTRHLSGVIVVIAFAGCAKGADSGAALACPAEWARDSTADTSLSVCVAPGFAHFDAHTWRRASPSNGDDVADFFSVELLSWPADSASVRGWPPRLASNDSCKADCITVDSTIVHQDQWSGYDAHTETGLASGGLAGLTRRPVMAAGWILSESRRGFAQGWSAVPATLDTLRQMLRTVKVNR